MPEEIAKRMGRPRLGPGTGWSDPMSVRFPEGLRQKVEQTAENADITTSELVRRALDLYTSREELRKDLLKLYDEDEHNEPDLRKYRDDMRRKSKSARMRARAGRFEPKT
jgi:hypothetical protein